MATCDVCGNSSFRQERVDEVFRIDGQLIMVEQVPARVCDRCEDVTFDCATVEQVRRAVHDRTRPVRHVNMDVLAFV